MNIRILNLCEVGNKDALLTCVFSEAKFILCSTEYTAEIRGLDLTRAISRATKLTHMTRKSSLGEESLAVPGFVQSFHVGSRLRDIR